MNLGLCSECGSEHIWKNLKTEEFYCKDCGFVLYPKKMTNADKIRNMTDKELAEELYGNINIDCCSLNAIFDWLKQEVKQMLKRRICSSCGRNNWRTSTFEDKYECMACGAIDQSFTEADRIRAMSDEELADFIHNVEGNYYSKSMIPSWEKWLKQEVES